MPTGTPKWKEAAAKAKETARITVDPKTQTFYMGGMKLDLTDPQTVKELERRLNGE